MGVLAGAFAGVFFFTGVFPFVGFFAFAGAAAFALSVVFVLAILVASAAAGSALSDTAQWRLCQCFLTFNVMQPVHLKILCVHSRISYFLSLLLSLYQILLTYVESY